MFRPTCLPNGLSASLPVDLENHSEHQHQHHEFFFFLSNRTLNTELSVQLLALASRQSRHHYLSVLNSIFLPVLTSQSLLEGCQAKGVNDVFYIIILRHISGPVPFMAINLREMHASDAYPSYLLPSIKNFYRYWFPSSCTNPGIMNSCWSQSSVPEKLRITENE